MIAEPLRAAEFNFDGQPDPAGPSVHTWPMAGRSGELETIAVAIARGRGVVLTGEQGVGRSMLLTAALERANGHLIRPDMLAGFAHNGSRSLIVGIDDAEALRADVAEQVSRLAALDGVTVLAAVRTGAWVPEAISRLWLDGLAERVEVGPLDHDGIAEVLHARLGAIVDKTTTQGMGLLTAGNAQLLRELTEHAVSEGSLRLKAGVWRWSGLACADGRLADVVRTRIGKLTPDESELVDMVAMAKALYVDVVPGLERAAESLNQRGVLTAESVRGRLRLRMTYPLCGEVVAAVMPELTARRLRVKLAVTAVKHPPHHETTRSNRTSALRVGITLTSRELEIADYAAIGFTSRRIADLLVLSPRTVENHLQRVYGKLGITRRTELAKALAGDPPVAGGARTRVADPLRRPNTAS